MPVEIRRSQDLSQETKRKLGPGPDPFGMQAHTLSWREKDWHFFLDVDGEPVSHVGVLRQDVLVDGVPVPVAGLGGVITAPGFQGRGFAQALLREAVAFMTDELDADFGFLFCLPRLIPFYERLGWQTLPRPVLIEQPGGVMEFPFESMVLPLRGRPWPPGRVETQSLPW
ncbi:MAG TPA: GNAT family N-acetyltransferase [Thermoanaerobaculia bacterium]|nr:GNAT family N-acetyltransferase [Thermoanaerobaculia bacterium]